MRIRGKILVLRLISYAQQEVDWCLRAQTKFVSSQIQLPLTTELQLLNMQHTFCSVMCYTTNLNTNYIDIRKQHTVTFI